MDRGRHIALLGTFEGADAAVEVGDALGDHIGQVLLVEVVGGVDRFVVDPYDLGGHADGMEDLLAVACKEANEESGVTAVPVSPEIFSVEILGVAGHVKRGKYVSAHLHLNVSYLLEADETDPLTPRPGENSAVGWLPVDGLPGLTNEWQMDDVYRKLLQRAGAAV